MPQETSFGQIIKERRRLLDLTQTELARRVGCAAITIRKIEADTLRPSVQVAERLAMALAIPLEERADFIRLARINVLAEPSPSPAPTPSVMPTEIGQEDLGGRAIRGYELGERLGSGGFGVVYRAVQPLVEREVAIKIVLPQYANHPDFIRRFEAEAQLVARLEHPHIVPLYDYWREPGVAYLVMRLLRGGSLENTLKQGPLSLAMINRLVEQIGTALHVAHRTGVVHRDLKPANILLDEDGNGYLADFGIAKHLGNPNWEEQTEVGAIMGSPAYLSPEQIRADPVRPQTDIYSFGVMLYELLTGQKPFRGSTPLVLMQQHLETALPRLTAYSPDLPAALEAILERATAKDPLQRYPDMPSLLAELRPALGATNGARGDQAAARRPLDEATLVAISAVRNPYKGLRAFDEADAEDFFGRETLTQQLLARMAEVGDVAAGGGQEFARFLAVVGPSGSGKSSVVRAGLVPALRRGGLPGSENWFIVEVMPGSHPLEELEAALLRVAVNPPESLLAQLREDERGLLRAVRRILPADPAIELVLIIDQFEELFTLVEAEAVRAHLLDSLVTAILEPRSRLRVIITLRADFTGRPLQYVDFGELMRQRTEFILPLTPDELEQAMGEPARQAGLLLEEGLATAIIRDLSDQPGTLPLLQYVLTELFERREGRTLTKAAYQASGGVLGALARRADELYNSLDPAGQEAVRQLFLRLVTLGEGTEDTRRRVLQEELVSLGTEGVGEQGSRGEKSVGVWGSEAEGETIQNPKSEIQNVIDLFGRYRLLTFDHDPLTRGPTVEIAHEALLREWGRLQEWLQSSRTDVRMQRLLAAAATEWRQANRDEGFLLRGARLDQFESWSAETKLALTGGERAYLKASLVARQERQAAEEARQQRELETAQKLAETEARAARRFRWLAVGLAVFLALALGAAWFAFNQRSIAQNNFVTAERIRLAAQAQIVLDNGEGGDLPALLALRSLQQGYSPEADAALLAALKRGFTRQRYLGHTDDIRMVDFSPDGLYVLTASDDQTARLWNAQTGQELRQFTGHTAPLISAIFSPDGLSILTSSFDNTARLWNVETGQEVRQFGGHTGGVWGIIFTPDGRYIFTSDTVLARMWNAQTGEEVRQFKGHTDTVFWLKVSPDGRYLATFSADKTARLWDVQTGQEIRQFVGHTDWLSGGQFSPDGRYLLTTSADQTARLWDIQNGQEIRRFVGHTDDVFDGIFSPDGRYILTTGYDKTARLWDISSGREMHQFLGHTDWVSTPDFSADGRYLLTGSGDRTARLWEVEPEIEPQTLTSFVGGYHLDMYTLSPSSDKKFWLTAWTDGTIQVWDALSNKVVQKINFKTTSINAQAISADNRWVLAGDNEGMVRLADIETGRVVGEFVGHSGPIWDLAFSPDGKYILSGSEDQTARLWDITSGQEIIQLAGHTGPVRAVAFSPEGQFILTGSDDHTARLWSRQSGEEIQQFTGHAAVVLDVAFSQDGRFILTGSADNTAQRWVVDTGQELQRFTGHTGQVSRVLFSPDGGYVLTASTDQTARLWDAETGQEVRRFVGHTSPILFVDFSADGQSILTGDARMTLSWQTRLEAVTDFTCTHLSRDFTEEERARYNITDPAPTCPNLTEQTVEVEPTWTPVPPGSVKASPLALTVEMEFLNESANIQMAMPIQDVYVEAGNGQVMRPTTLNAETLALPVYRSAVGVEMDYFEAPFETGPYPKGESLGFTLEDYVAATGHGTYIVQGDRAKVELTFDHLVPKGLYTVWCVTLFFSTASMSEFPCMAPDGSMYSFTADEKGQAEISMDIAAFPPSTTDTVYEIAIAYHSDGRAHGASVGEHGLNAHGQMFYDFLPPDGHPSPLAPQSTVAEDSAAVAREWMQLLLDRVQADTLPPPVAARIYGYAGITLYEAVVPGVPDYKSLQGQLNDMPELPQPEGGPYNWPAVAASAADVVAKALFESPTSQAAFDQLRDQQLAGLEESGVAADILARSTAHGQSLGQAIVDWIETDGYQELKTQSYTPPTGPGYWVPTSVTRTKPTTPYWGELRPLALTAADTCKPPASVPYSEDTSSAFYAQAREVYDTSQTLTVEQKAEVLFWSDSPGMTGTPPGHWVSIVNQLSEEQGLSLEQTAELHALVSIGLADAFISCWQEKYRVSLIRPESYIQQYIDPDWEPLIPTPPFPEYPSGHSAASAAAAEILTELLGPLAFTDTTHASRGLGVRHFASFIEAAEEAAMSRLYGGIHYRMGVENGLAQGQCIGQAVLERVQTH